MDQKFINPINEPEKLVVGGLYEVGRPRLGSRCILNSLKQICG